MGGTLTIRHTRLKPPVLSFGAWKTSGDRVWRARCWVLRERLSWSLPWNRRSYLRSTLGAVRVGDRSLFENCTVDASICGQVFKGARWMPWH